MNLKLKLLLAGAMIAVASPVFAADLAPAPVEPIAPVIVPFTWTGFYIGADVGYSWSSVDSDISDGIDTLRLSPDSDGVVGGLYVGYNAQFNSIVVGLEADIEASSNSGDDSIGTALGTLHSSADKNWQGSVRARLGYAIDNFLPYVTAGVAFSDWDLDYRIDGVGSVSNSDTFTGWTVGAGAEYAFTPNLIGRVEYRYTDFGDTDFSGIGLTNRVDLNDSTVRVGIAYKF